MGRPLDGMQERKDPFLHTLILARQSMDVKANLFFAGKSSQNVRFRLDFPAPAGIIEHGSICQFRHFAACWRFWEPAPFAARPRGNAPMGEGSRYIWIPGTNAPRAVLRPQTAPCAARTRRCRSSSPAAQGGSGQDAQTDLTAPDAASAQDGQAWPLPAGYPHRRRADRTAHRRGKQRRYSRPHPHAGWGRRCLPCRGCTGALWLYVPAAPQGFVLPGRKSAI